MTSRREGFRAPAEWTQHAATWVAWPSHADLWQENLSGARQAVEDLVRAVAPGETVNVLTPTDESQRVAQAALSTQRVRFHRIPFGDIWLRDTAPLFLTDDGGRLASARFAFNGWGGKYILEDDERVAERIATLVGGRQFASPFVLEGGAVEFDGEGTILTTRQCMLNPNRNGPTGKDTVEAVLRETLGAEKVLWLKEGLKNDHTDGHVDTIVRFVQAGVVVAMEPDTLDDPNRDVLRSLLEEARTLVDARGRKIEVATIPSPGRVVDDEGRVMPASYANFYIGNEAVVVPTYGVRGDDEAVDAIATLFPGRRAVGVDARALLAGGGAFHCITQQQPSGVP